MNNTILLVYDQEQPMGSVRATLEKQGKGTIRARGCTEALSILSQDNAPAVILTDLTICDGSWADALRLARRSPSPVAFIVVSHFVDVSLYRAAMEIGALDFIVPPFTDNAVARVIQRATDDVTRRRNLKTMFAKTA